MAYVCPIIYHVLMVAILALVPLLVTIVYLNFLLIIASVYPLIHHVLKVVLYALVPMFVTFVVINFI